MGKSPNSTTGKLFGILGVKKVKQKAHELGVKVGLTTAAEQAPPATSAPAMPAPLPKDYQHGLLVLTGKERIIPMPDSALNVSSSKRDMVGEIVTNPKEAVQAFWGHAKFIPIEGPIFKEFPTISQIMQGYHGHCFIAASVMQLMHQSPLELLKMMKDNGDTVDVRLYEPNGEPVIYRVDKTDAQALGGGVVKFHASDALFAPILKAVGSHLMRHDPAAYAGKNYLQVTGSGGVSAEVLQMFTGKKGEALDIYHVLYNKGLDQLSDLLADDTFVAFQARSSGALARLLIKIEDYHTGVRNGQIKVDDNKQQITDILNEIKSLPNLTDAKFGQQLQQYFITMQDGFNVMDNKPTNKQTEKVVFEHIEASFKKGTYMVTSTKDELPKAEKTIGFRETIYKGLVAQHQYALIDVKRRMDAQGNEKLFVVVANPWGKYARQDSLDQKTQEVVYTGTRQQQDAKQLDARQEQVHGKAVETEKYTAGGMTGDIANYSGVSEIEISDYLQYFDRIDSCAAQNEKDICINQIYMILQLAYAVNEKSDELDTVFANPKYPVYQQFF